MESSHLHAVATGDIIESTELELASTEHLPQILERVYRKIQAPSPGSLPHNLGIVGGDGWQIYIPNPSLALAHVIQYWSLLHAQGITNRVVVALDTVDYIEEKDPNRSNGAAFRKSGRGLKKLDDQTRFELELPDDAPPLFAVAETFLSELVDLLFHDWSTKQAQAIGGVLKGWATGKEVTQESIAENWQPEPVTRQTVNRHLKRAQWDRVKRILPQFEKLCSNLSREYSKHA